MTTENKTTKKVAHAAWKLLLVLAGNTLYALGVALFVLPTGLITGGTTGLGLVAQNYLRIPLPAFVAVFNVAMFLLGLAVLGKVFALTTVLSALFITRSSWRCSRGPLGTRTSPTTRCWPPSWPG